MLSHIWRHESSGNYHPLLGVNLSVKKYSSVYNQFPNDNLYVRLRKHVSLHIFKLTLLKCTKYVRI